MSFGGASFELLQQPGSTGITARRKPFPASRRICRGRTRHWLKFKNPAAPAVKREAEEDWGKR